MRIDRVPAARTSAHGFSSPSCQPGAVHLDQIDRQHAGESARCPGQAVAASRARARESVLHVSGRRHGRCARPLRVLGTCLSSGTLARDSVHLVPGVSHQRGCTSRVALYLELGDGLGGGRGGLRSHAQTAHLVHAAGPRSARSRALSPASSRAVPVLVTTSGRGRDRARSSCCTRRNTY